jgi:hypothetical protein
MNAKTPNEIEQLRDPEWSNISDAVCNAELAATDAFVALVAFDSGAPKKGGQKAYDKWRDANNEKRFELEFAALDAARAFVEAHDAQAEYFDREDEIEARKAAN